MMFWLMRIAPGSSVTGPHADRSSGARFLMFLLGPVRPDRRSDEAFWRMRCSGTEAA